MVFNINRYLTVPQILRLKDNRRTRISGQLKEGIRVRTELMQIPVTTIQLKSIRPEQVLNDNALILNHLTLVKTRNGDPRKLATVNGVGLSRVVHIKHRRNGCHRNDALRNPRIVGGTFHESDKVAHGEDINLTPVR